MKGKTILEPFLRGEYDVEISDEKFKELEKELESHRDTIVSIFLQAVDSHDGKMIMELANGVWFLKDKRLPHRVPADRERSTLLALKGVLDHAGEKIPIRLLAEFLALEAKAAGKPFEASQDGYSALRRKCREINFPLAESRKRKPKKPL